MSKKVPPVIAADNAPLLHTGRWRFGEFELDESCRELRRAGVLVELEPKPLNLLMLMLRHPGELITKNDLMEALWTGRIVSDTVLTNCVSKLRAALDDDAAQKLRTVPGYGYRLEGNPQLIAEPPLPVPATISFEVDAPVPLRPNWRFVRRIGRSGECWLAVLPKTGERRVFKFAFDPKALSALKREVTLYRLLRQTLEERAPVLDLLDWNFDEPPWFIETSYCELGSLQEYVEARGGCEQMSLDERLQIVAQIADALSAVHALGILHKDLKPANVLLRAAVAGGVEIRLCDFGSGRLLDDSRLAELSLTRLGFTQFVDPTANSSSGTPLYYAPEVLSGQPVTLKADIYALGVILYQLVVGDLRRLFAPGWEAGIDDELLREDIADTAAGDMTLRLPDAALLARGLRERPARLQARRDEREAAADAIVTAREFELMKARRLGLQLAAGALAFGFLVSLALVWKTHRAETAALLSAGRAEAVTRYLLGDVLGKLTNPREPVRGLTVLQLLDHAAEKVGSRFQTEPKTASELRLTLGDAYWQFGQADAAIQQLQQALDAELAVAGPVSSTALKAAALLLPLQAHAGPLGIGRARYDTLLDNGQKQWGERNLDVLALQLRLAQASELEGHYAEAKTRFQTLLKLADSTPGAEALALEARSLLGVLLMRQAEYPLAEQTLKAVLATLDKTGREDDREAAKMHMRLGLMLIDWSHLSEAGQQLDAAERIIKRWEPSGGYISVVIASHRVRLAHARGDVAAAYAAERALLALRAQEASEGGDAFSDALLFARTRRLDHKPDEALTLISKADTLLQGFRDPENPDHVELALEKANILLALKQPTQARQTLEVVPAQAWALLPAEHPWNAERLLLEARIAQTQGDSASAQTKAQTALKFFTARLGSLHPSAIEAANFLAILHTAP